MRLVSATLAVVLSLGGAQRFTPAFDIGVTTSLNRVFPDQRATFTGTRIHEARVELARNEYEAVQLVVFPNRALSHLTASVSDLRQSGGGATMSSSDIAINLIGAVNLVEPRFRASSPGWYPDPVLPNDTIDVAANALQSFLVTVRTRPDTRSGDFTGVVRFKASTSDGARVADSVLLRVHVWNFVLPKAPHFKSAALCSWELPNKMWPGNAFSHDETTTLMLRFADLGYRNRLPPSVCLANGLGSWNWKGQGDTKLVFPTHDEGTFNSARTGRLIDYMLEHGANHFFVGMTSNPFALPAQAAVREARMRSYLTEYRAYLASRKLLSYAYVYGVDEPWGDVVPDAKRVYRLVKEVAPEFHFLQNTNQNNDRAIGVFLGSFDALDINLGWFDSTRVERYRQQSPATLKELWWNVNVWPDVHPNLFLEYPLTDARIIGPMSYKLSVQGFEYWDVIAKAGVRNYHPVARGETRVQWDVGRESLDGTLVYPGATNRQIYSSMRFESLRDGFEDAEYLYLLAEKDPKNALLGVPIVSSISKFSTSPDSILAFRRRVAQALEAHR